MADIRIQISPEELLTEATRVANLREEYDSIISQLGSIIQSLGGNAWMGKSQTSMAQKYDNMRPAFQQFSQLLEEYYTDMRRVATEMEETDNETAQVIRSRAFM